MVQVTAHAGCEGTAMDSWENLKLAMELDADLVEIDLRMLNGEIYLSHNPLDTRHLQDYVTLRQAAELLHDSRSGINCDLKEPEVLAPAMELLGNAGMADRVLFTGEVLTDQVQLPFRYFQNIENCGLVREGEVLTLTTAQLLLQRYQDRREDTLAGYNVEYRTLTDEVLRFFADNHVPLCCWQVDDEADLRRLMQAGVSYITTNALRLAVGVKQKLMKQP